MIVLGEIVLDCPLRMCHTGSGKRLVWRGEKEVVATLLDKFLKGSKSTHEGRILLIEGYRYLSMCLTVSSQTVFMTYFTGVSQRELQRGCLSPLMLIIITILPKARILNSSHYICISFPSLWNASFPFSYTQTF